MRDRIVFKLSGHDADAALGLLRAGEQWLSSRESIARRIVSPQARSQPSPRDKIIKPLLAGVVRSVGRAPKIQAAVDRHYVRLREELNRTFETIRLVPAVKNSQENGNMLSFVVRLAAK